MRAALGAVLAGFVLIATAPFALESRLLGNVTSQATDQDSFHLPAIRNLAAGRVEWTAVGVAMIPGYHAALAPVFRIAGEPGVRIVNVAAAVALIVLAYSVARRYAGAGAAALTLPLACSPYVLGSAIWITTDNAGWLLAGLVLASALQGGDSAARFSLRGAGALLAVLVRQVHAWVIVPVVAAGIDTTTGRWPAGALARGTTACLPAVVALVVFWLIWGGPVPPLYQTTYAARWNLATPVAILALAGIFGFFFAGVPTGDVVRRPAARWLLPGAAAMSAMVPTGYSVAEGRWGGPLWEIVRLLPAIGGRSLVLVPLAVAGTAVMLALYGRAVSRGRSREARILVVSLAAWACAQTMSMQAFQRYLEPGVLLGLAWLSALSLTTSPPGVADRWRFSGPIVLSVLLLAIDWLSIYRPLWQ